MANIDKILEKMRLSPSNVKFGDACKVCEHYFGEPRQKGTNHRIYRYYNRSRVVRKFLLGYFKPI